VRVTLKTYKPNAEHVILVHIKGCAKNVTAGYWQ